MVNADLYNEDELHAPEWLNKEFLEKVLRNNHEATSIVEINKFDVTPGTTKSDHYASIMFRAKVKYTLTVEGEGEQQKSQSMIIKTMPTEGQKQENLEQMSIFETEIKMYAETLPQLEQILRDKGEDTQLCAKVLYHSLQPIKCIVFEDLVEKGFKAISGRCCKIEEVKLAFLKLAQIHAASYKLLKEDNVSLKAYQNGLFTASGISDMEFVTSAVATIKDVLNDHEDLKQYIPHIENVQEGLVKSCVDLFEAYTHGQRDGIFVLNHGDFHMKNMMSNFVEGKLTDVMLVDYQLSFCGSSVIDLLYANIMMLSPEMRRDHWDEIKYYYFSNFQRILKLLKFDGHIPTRHEFEVEMLKHRKWELFLFFSFLVMDYVFTDPAGDLAKAVDDPEYRRQLFKNPKIIKEIGELLQRFLYRGYFLN